MNRFTRLIICGIILVSLNTCSSPPQSAPPNIHELTVERLRNRIETAGIPPQIIIGEERIHASQMLPLFYERRTYLPAWSDNSGPLGRVQDLVKAIREAEYEGLKPNDYHLTEIEKTLEAIYQEEKIQKTPNPYQLVDLDLLLTDAFLIYGSHLLAGRVNPETIDSEWLANRRGADLAEILQAALDANRIESALKDLLPPQPGYARLKIALATYRKIANDGGWSLIPDGPKIQKDESGERVIALRNRLVITGDLDSTIQDTSDLYDAVLEQAVRRFQTRHGLGVNGVVDPPTLVALNIPVEERVQQILLNLERWRWLPQELGKRYLLVNIANFELDVIENEQPLMMMRVVVGKNYRRTPVFSDKMTYLVLSPYWQVPPGIAVNDILPAVRKAPDYLVKKNIKVFQGWSAEVTEIDPNSIDWSKVTAKQFNYRFRQEPGPENALGRVKFMFPNKFNVYLHDTPARELFQKTERTFSSGCIRIERPIELAEYLLRGDPQWTREKILAAIDKRFEQTVRLPEPIDVHLLYWTTWVNDNGTIQFRKDIYGRDKTLLTALYEKPPVL